MRKSNLGLYAKLAVEEIADAAVATPPAAEATAAVITAEPPVVEIEAGADSLEADMIGVNADVTEAQDNETIIGNALDVTEKLDVVVESLKVHAQNGGIGRDAAHYLNLHLESLYQSVNMPPAAIATRTLAVESFGGTTSKKDSTKLAIEEVEATNENIYEKVVELYQKAMEHLKALWAKVFDAAAKTKARAEKIQSAADATKGEAKSATLESPQLAELLQLGGKVDGKAAAQALATAAAGLGETMTANKTQAEGLLASLKTGSTDVPADGAAAAPAAEPAADKPAEKTDAAPAAKAEGEDGDDKGDLATEGLEGGAAFAAPADYKKVDPAKAGMAAPSDGLAVYASPTELPGNKALAVIAPDEGAGTPDQLGKVKTLVVSFDAGRKLEESTALPTLSPADASAVASSIIQVADAVLAYKEVQDQIDGIKTAVIDTVKGQDGAASDSKEAATATMAVATSFGPALAAYLLNTGMYALQYAEQSLKQYDGAGAEAAPAEETPAAETPAEGTDAGAEGGDKSADGGEAAPADKPKDGEEAAT